MSTGTGGGESLLRFAGADTVLLIHDREWLRQRVRAVAEETLSESALIAEEGDKHAMDNVVDAEQFCCDIDSHRYADYAVSNRGDYDAALTFDTSLQGVFHKNFDIISSTFRQFESDGYKIYILSDSEPQFERLRSIFDDRKDDIRFTPVLRTLHEDLSTTSVRFARLPTIRFLNASISTRSRATVCVRASWLCR